MARIWYVSPGSRTLREQRPLPWCIDKLWISPRNYQSAQLPDAKKPEAVWIEVTEEEVSQAPGYRPGYYLSFLTPSELEDRLRHV